MVRLRDLGATVHAGADIRKRGIELDPDLANRPSELARILIHEIFHFAWVRLGNQRRNQYAALVGREFRQGVRGELGWSSEYRKMALEGCSRGGRAHPRWREYVCESFCDTAAWRYSGLSKHNEFTLAKRYRGARESWFAESFDGRPISI